MRPNLRQTDQMYGKISSFDGENAFLSNSYNASVKYEGHAYPSVENAFQAAKVNNDALTRLRIAKLSPAEAKREGKLLTLRDDWADVKEVIMVQLLRSKFSDASLRNSLVKTKTAILEQGSSGDKFWGVVDEVGENRLGVCLMCVRRELKTGLPTNEYKNFAEIKNAIEPKGTAEESTEAEPDTGNGDSSSAGSSTDCYSERVFDLFAMPGDWALAHCVSVDLAMGKGIAVAFDNKFGGRAELAEQQPFVGGCCFLTRPSSAADNTAAAVGGGGGEGNQTDEPTIPKVNAEGGDCQMAEPTLPAQHLEEEDDDCQSFADKTDSTTGPAIADNNIGTSIQSGERKVYYLITKAKYHGKPTVESLDASLISMRQLMVLHGVKKLAMPQIGCGLDGLQWPVVRKLIVKVFSVLPDVTVTVCMRDGGGGGGGNRGHRWRGASGGRGGDRVRGGAGGGFGGGDGERMRGGERVRGGRGGGEHVRGGRGGGEHVRGGRGGGEHVRGGRGGGEHVRGGRGGGEHVRGGRGGGEHVRGRGRGSFRGA